ncbi:MAG: hypothetical protein ACRECX_11345 [Methyloceanibacter sp.]|uniref:hypothetical protein n=1 Tax=Methyloceanibacter sp. TaxID=1965321 RepID=UPI003D6D70EE
MISLNMRVPGTALTAVAAMSFCLATPAHAKSNTAAVVGGIIAGAAVGAVVSSEINHSKKVYVREKPKPSSWDQSFSPKPGVMCYPAHRACYNSNGAYSANWTYKVYAR